MRQLRAAVMRIAGLFARDRRDRDSISSSTIISSGRSTTTATRGCRRKKRAVRRWRGSAASTSVKETYRDRRGIPLLETTVQDVRYALRTLRVNPGATRLGILVMALGIGANTAVFSVVHAVLLNPLSVRATRPHRHALVRAAQRGRAGDRSRQVSIPDFLDWQAQSTSFEAMAFWSASRQSVVAKSIAEYTTVVTATNGFFGRLPCSRPSAEGSALTTGGKAARAPPSSAIGMHGSSSASPRVRSGGRALLQSVCADCRWSWPSFDFPVARTSGFPRKWSPGVPPRHRRGNNYRAVARSEA